MRGHCLPSHPAHGRPATFHRTPSRPAGVRRDGNRPAEGSATGHRMSPVGRSACGHHSEMALSATMSERGWVVIGGFSWPIVGGFSSRTHHGHIEV